MTEYYCEACGEFFETSAEVPRCPDCGAQEYTEVEDGK